MITLSNLTSAGKSRKRVGRGGSRGGTSGRGNKGQKARSGPNIGKAFEGGQTSLARRLPKRGFSHARFRQEWEIVNIGCLNSLYDHGAEVTKTSLIEKGVISGGQAIRLKILGKGLLDKKLSVHADAFSTSAEEAIKKQGGEVHTL